MADFFLTQTKVICLIKLFIFQFLPLNFPTKIEGNFESFGDNCYGDDDGGGSDGDHNVNDDTDGDFGCVGDDCDSCSGGIGDGDDHNDNDHKFFALVMVVLISVIMTIMMNVTVTMIIMTNVGGDGEYGDDDGG